MKSTDHGLRRDLKLRDLVLMQVTLIFSLSWTGFAAKEGSTQFALWFFAILLFYMPLAAVVMKLSREIPIEGGVYQWTKQGIGPFAGFMAGWNVTVYAVVAFAAAGPTLANSVSWAAGRESSWMTTSKAFAVALTALFCQTAYLVNVRGLHLTKWVSGGGSLLSIASSLVLFYLLIKAWASGTPLFRGSLSFAWPSFSVTTMNVLAKMSVGALGGFESSAMFAEECRKPQSDVARSVFIAAPVIAFMYILGTAALLAYTPSEKIDLAAPVPQAMHAGFGSTSLGVSMGVISVAAFTIATTASQLFFIGMVARLPMVAGWDGLLPAWWSELHPTFRAPYKAIGGVSAAIMFMSVLTLWGAGNQEAYQVSTAVSIASLCIMYMLLFGAVLFGFHSCSQRPGRMLQLGAGAAFIVALGSLLFEIVPLGEVKSSNFFAVKVAAGTCATNALGAYLYWRGTRHPTPSSTT